MKNTKILQLILPAFGAAIITALAQMIIPIGAVPVTLQTLAIGLVATLLKPKEATYAALLYLLLGAIGLPVFAGASGGFQTFFSPTVGYLIAYPLFAFITSSLTKVDTPIWRILLAFILGDIPVFVLGVLSLHFLGQMSWTVAWTAGVLPFIIPDILKGLFVALLAKPLFKALKNETYFN